MITLLNYMSLLKNNINDNFDNFYTTTSCLKRTILTGKHFNKNNKQCNLIKIK